MSQDEAVVKINRSLMIMLGSHIFVVVSMIAGGAWWASGISLNQVNTTKGVEKVDAKIEKMGNDLQTLLSTRYTREDAKSERDILVLALNQLGDRVTVVQNRQTINEERIRQLEMKPK